MSKFLNRNKFLIIILVLTSFFRLFNLGYPRAYVFDEVYHAFTAKEYLKGNVAAWEWWTTPPPGVAYEWTHPPLAKEIMAFSMLVFQNTDSLFWRLPGAILGIISVYLVYLLGLEIFKKKSTALISAFIFSVDGLNFVQSRTGMNDIYIVTFSLLALFLFLRKKIFLSSIFVGLALASKWSGIYMVAMLIILSIKDRNFKVIPLFIITPLVIYMISYIPFFALGLSWDQFLELQHQMYYYHTHLKATHTYSSSWWTWPLNLYPVWYFVEYHSDSISNIWACGNPIVFWGGAVAVLYSSLDFVKKEFKNLLKGLTSNPMFIPLLGFFIFWLPWAVSPRIMFLYHYSPSVPFMSLVLGENLSGLLDKKKDRVMLFAILGLIFLGFLAIYPFLVGLSVPKNLVPLFFQFHLAKDPFR